MFEPLPKRIDPERDVKRGCRFGGTYPVARMGRLLPSLCSDRGEVEVVLEVGRDPDGVAFLRGTARTRLQMVCQRCMEPVEIPLEVEFSLGLAESEGMAERLPEAYEPLLVEPQGFVEPLAVVEDELILALPIVPKHDHCRAAAKQQVTEETENERDNPFAALAALKRSE